MEYLPEFSRNFERVPRHVAIIMDGNGRWAKARGLPRAAGHRNGAEAVRRAVKSAIRHEVEFLTLFGFSSENWRRPETEIHDLMGLLRRYLQSEIAELHENGVRVQVIGDRSRLPQDIVQLIDQAESRTRTNIRLTLTVALSYGGRLEIVEAARSLARRVAAGDLQPEDIDEELFESRLSTTGIPDPDMVIRTSGEKRISNFLLWQSAYAEFIFLDTLWPDFSAEDFAAAIAEFNRRERRYGTAVSSG
ncbi:MAG: isoprenyl transferase [Rhodovibrionaceae bacterium]|nr:isoprenyl transferase [Rhodovibrionaceae bacterium]